MAQIFPHIVYGRTTPLDDTADDLNSIDKIVEEVVRECQPRTTSPTRQESKTRSTPSPKLVIGEAESPTACLEEKDMDRKEKGERPIPPRPLPLRPGDISQQSMLRSILLGHHNYPGFPEVRDFGWGFQL